MHASLFICVPGNDLSSIEAAAAKNSSSTHAILPFRAIFTHSDEGCHMSSKNLFTISLVFHVLNIRTCNQISGASQLMLYKLFVFFH
jgi:hypothetical protein